MKRFCQSQLTAAANQIMERVGGTEIHISLQIVGKETNSLLHGQDIGAESKRFDFVFRQAWSKKGQVAVSETAEYLHIDSNTVVVRAVLCLRVGGSAERVTEVVANKSRHNGVKINDGESMSLFIKEDIVDFGVIVSHTQRKLAFIMQVCKAAGQVFVVE